MADTDTSLTEKNAEDRSQEVEDSFYQEYLDNFPFYAENQLKIQTLEGEVVPFTLNDIQWILEQIIADIKSRGNLIRLIILKARREGVSTWFTGRCFWQVSTDKNRYAVLVTHEPQATDFLFKMQKRYYDNLEPEFKPESKYNNTSQLDFNNKEGTGLDSAITVGTAGKKDFGSGQLIHFLHLSEVAKWPAENQEDLLTSLLQCVPDLPESMIVFESTAKGIGGAFYDRYYDSRHIYEISLNPKTQQPIARMTVNDKASPDNAYCSIFIPWFVFSHYEMDPPEPLMLDDEEIHLVKMYGLNHRKLQWRRWAIENKCGGKVDTFHQEYPSNAREAFLASGRPVFDVKKLEALIPVAPAPSQRYEVEISTGNFIAAKDGRFKVWQEPKVERSYIVSGDVAEGLEHGDYSVIDVIDHISGVQVAHWHGHIDPDQYAKIMIYVGMRYNTAWLAPERNNHGLEVVSRILEAKYPKLYVETIEDPPHRKRKRFGWLTNRKTKPAIIDNLVADFREDNHGIREVGTFHEMMTFKHMEDGSMEAEVGMCDDRVMSYAIGKFLCRKLKPSHFHIKYSPREVQKPPSVGAWT